MATQEGQPWPWSSGNGAGCRGGAGALSGGEEPASSCGRPPGTGPLPPSRSAQPRCSGVPMGAEAAPLPHSGPHGEPHGRGGGGRRPWRLRTSGLWKPAGAAGEKLAPGREGPPGGERGWGSRQQGARPQPLCWGGRAGAGAGPDWDRLGDRGPFVWGFMACEAALPARQEAPIGTRLARGAQGRGQEEREGGSSTASHRLRHRFGFPGCPTAPHRAPQAAWPCAVPAAVPPALAPSPGWRMLLGPATSSRPRSSTRHLRVPQRGRPARRFAPGRLAVVGACVSEARLA